MPRLANLHPAKVTGPVLPWFTGRLAWPAGERRRTAALRRSAYALAGILLIGQVAVAIAYSGSIGLVLIAASAGLGGVLFRGLQSLRMPQSDDDDPARIPFIDSETHLPTRQHLLETLARDVARAERYSHPLTLAVIRIRQFEEMKTVFGPAAAALAVQHVADSLRRVIRAGDFFARLDEGRFAVVLPECSNRQAALLADRLALAVSSRPVEPSSRTTGPRHVGVEIRAVEYDAERFQDPLEFLNHAGGGGLRRTAPTGMAARRGALAADPRILRGHLVRDYFGNPDTIGLRQAEREIQASDRHAG